MATSYIAMDLASFSSTGNYGFADRCQITRAAGYDAVQTVIWDGSDWKQRLELAAVEDRLAVMVTPLTGPAPRF